MKYRTGFVTNSSSSSFLLAFDRPLTEISADELRNMMFGDHEYTCGGAWNDYKVSTLYAAELVKEKAKEVSFADIVERIESSESGEGWGQLDSPEMVSEFLSENEDKYLYEVEFPDNEGSTQSLLSTSSAYENIPHVQTMSH